MPFTTPSDRYNTANAMAPATTQPVQQPPNPWMTQPKPIDPAAAVGGNAMASRGAQLPAIQGNMTTTPNVLATAPTGGTFSPQQPTNPMAYGPNGGGLRVNPNYLPENWDYRQSPEYQQRLAWAQRDLNRQLLSMGRSDSTGGINAMARQQSEIAGQEIDKQYQRALQANMTNYGRMFGANVENYGRTRGEDQTGWDRAAYLDQTGWNRGAYLGEQDWNRNWQLANLGFNATNTGVQSGNQTGMALANLLSGNGANQASLALQRGVVSADRIQSLLNAGWTFLQIDQLFGGQQGGAPAGSTLGGVPGAVQPTLPAYSGAGIGNPGGSYQGASYTGGATTPGYDFFA